MGKRRFEIQKERERFLRKRESLLKGKISRLQRTLYYALSEVLDELEEADSGAIQFSLRNISVLNTGVELVFRSFADTVRSTFARWVASGVVQVLGLNKRYFQTIEPLKAETVHAKAVRLTLESLGWNEKTGVLPGSWLHSLTANEQVKQQVMLRLRTAMAGGMTVPEFRRQFRREFLDNNQGLGLVTKNMGFHAQNVFMSVDRQVQWLYAQELGLEHAVYAGTLKDTSRDFCRGRVNRVYRLEEIDKWNGKKWSGKIPGADVKVVLGGYGCRHTLNWVSEPIARQIAAQTGNPIDSYGEAD